MHSIILYGIKSCDTVRKARRFLDQQQLEYQFHDWRTDGVEPELLSHAADNLGWDALINKRSTTWRQLDEQQRNRPPLELLTEHPTLIKRPLVKHGTSFLLGFNAESWHQTLV